MLIKKINGKQPTFGEGCFFAENKNCFYNLFKIRKI